MTRVNNNVPRPEGSQREIFFQADDDKAEDSPLISDEKSESSEETQTINSDFDTNDGTVPDASESGEERPRSTITQGPKVWKVKKSKLTLSALEAEIATRADDPGPTDPVTGALSAAFGTVGTIAERASDYPLLFKKLLEEKEGDKKLREFTEFSKDSSKGVSGILGAALCAPMDITMNVSRGFNNLPKMYGDETREVEKVVDISSGLQAAGKSFGWGLWDGVSGVFTQPYKGAQKDGFVGGLVGFGKGLGGAVCKPAAGAVGLPAYAFKGIYENVQKARAISQEKEIAKENELQGCREWEKATEEERGFILAKIRKEMEDIVIDESQEY